MEGVSFKPAGAVSQMQKIQTRMEQQVRQARQAAQAQPAKSSGLGFTEAVRKMVNEVNAQQVKADESIEDLLTGKVHNIHEVVTNVAKADLSFKLMIQTRNKLVEAYKQTMNIQV